MKIWHLPLFLLAACGNPAVKSLLSDYVLPIGSIIAPDAIRSAVDFDGDGQADDMGFDFDGDGKIDMVDLDSDLTIDAYDFNGDGKFLFVIDLNTGADEPKTIDTDNDGTADGVDFDGDGTADGGVDENDDGKPDTAPPSAPPAEVIADVDVMRVDPRPLPPPPMPSMPPPVETKVSLGAKFPTPGDQGKLGSCAAWSTAAVATYLRAVRENVPADQIWASASYLYSEMLGALMAKCDSGTALYHGVEQLAKLGAPTLTATPYTDTQCIDRVANPAEPHKFRIGGWLPLYPWSRTQIKDYLRRGYPIVIGVSLPPNFNTWSGPKAKQETFKSDDGQLQNKHGAGHAMVIIGFDDDKQGYEIQNSWSTDWGDNGRFFWDYADFEKREPHGFVVFPPKGSPEALAAPSTNVTVTSAGAILSADKKTITVALEASEPVFVNIAAFDFAPNAKVQVEQTVSSGFITATFGGALPNPTNPQGYELSLQLKLRDGQSVTRNIITPQRQAR